MMHRHGLQRECQGVGVTQRSRGNGDEKGRIQGGEVRYRELEDATTGAPERRATPRQ